MYRYPLLTFFGVDDRPKGVTTARLCTVCARNCSQARRAARVLGCTSAVSELLACSQSSGRLPPGFPIAWCIIDVSVPTAEHMATIFAALASNGIKLPGVIISDKVVRPPPTRFPLFVAPNHGVQDKSTIAAVEKLGLRLLLCYFHLLVAHYVIRISQYSYAHHNGLPPDNCTAKLLLAHTRESSRPGRSG